MRIRWLTVILALIFSTQPTFVASAQRLTNPVFHSQDPWVVLINGTYYYTESGCAGTGATICIRHSISLSGLASAAPAIVWTAPGSGINSTDIWAPQVQYVDGNWYLYYSADAGDNKHQMFVLVPTIPGNPLGPWTWGSPSVSGYPNGLLPHTMTNPWAIDQDGRSCRRRQQGCLYQLQRFSRRAPEWSDIQLF